MRYVNNHLVEKKFKFEGLKDIADMAEKGDHAVSYDLTSGYYHVSLHPSSRPYVGFKWDGKYYMYNCLPFGLSTAPWVFSKVMRELVMFWRAKGVNILPYLDDFFFLKKGFAPCRLVAIMVEHDMALAGLKINWDKSSGVPSLTHFHLGFDVDLELGMFSVPLSRWEVLLTSTDLIINARRGRVQARTLASLVGTIISMKLAWGPVTQLYTRHLYALINSVISFNCWVTLNDEVSNELLFWQHLPRLKFTSDIWPNNHGLTFRVATDASDIGWGGHSLSGPSMVAQRVFYFL
jgi:hypothetical protein